MSNLDLLTAGFSAIFDGGLPSSSVHDLHSRTYRPTTPLRQSPQSTRLSFTCTNDFGIVVYQNSLPPYLVGYVDPTGLDPRFDYDFQNRTSDGYVYWRGGFEYQRPYGWNRIAVHVLGRYGNNVWLGPNGLRTAQAWGEWPVSYHGTNVRFANNIIKEGFKPGPRAKFGEGIYSSPSLEMVEKNYAKEFIHNGKIYKIAFQNRVNPYRLNIVPASMTNAGADYWLSEEGDIRPYGVLVKEIGQIVQRFSYNYKCYY